MQNDSLISEKDYPIQPIWLLSIVIPHLLRSIIAVLLFTMYFATTLVTSPDRTPESDFGAILFLIIFGYQAFLIIPVSFFWAMLRRYYFKYSLEPNFIRTYEGVFTKSNRQISYSVIQHVIVHQRFIERLLKIATLEIENASQAGGLYNFNNNINVMGSTSNKITIPGLRVNDAEELKKLILNKIQTTKGNDTGM